MPQQYTYQTLFAVLRATARVAAKVLRPGRCSVTFNRDVASNCDLRAAVVAGRRPQKHVRGLHGAGTDTPLEVVARAAAADDDNGVVVVRVDAVAVVVVVVVVVVVAAARVGDVVAVAAVVVDVVAAARVGPVVAVADAGAAVYIPWARSTTWCSCVALIIIVICHHCNSTNMKKLGLNPLGLNDPGLPITLPLVKRAGSNSGDMPCGSGVAPGMGNAPKPPIMLGGDGVSGPVGGYIMCGRSTKYLGPWLVMTRVGAEGWNPGGMYPG